MKKRLLSLILGLSLIIHAGTMVSVLASDDNVLIPPATPRLKPIELDYRFVEPISLDIDQSLSSEQVRKPASNEDTSDNMCIPLSAPCFITQKNQIRSYIGDNFVYVHINPDESRNIPLLIFRAPCGKYMAYRPSTCRDDERAHIISAVERYENVEVFGIDRLLYFTQDVILNLN